MKDRMTLADEQANAYQAAEYRAAGFPASPDVAVGHPRQRATLQMRAEEIEMLVGHLGDAIEFLAARLEAVSEAPSTETKTQSLAQVMAADCKLDARFAATSAALVRLRDYANDLANRLCV